MYFGGQRLVDGRRHVTEDALDDIGGLGEFGGFGEVGGIDALDSENLTDDDVMVPIEQSLKRVPRALKIQRWRTH